MVGNACVRPDECFSTGSSKYSEYHYEFLYKRGYFTKKVYNDYRGACLLNSDNYECFVQRKKLDGYFNDTNSSLYNIYDKCYKSKNTSRQYINTGCEDNAGLTTFLNDPSVKKNWNIDTTKEWAPCDDNVFKEYLGKNNSYWIFPLLIQNKLKIVQFLLFSGSTRETSTPTSPSSAPSAGCKTWGTLSTCQSKEFGENGGFQEGTRERIKSAASSGNLEISLLLLSKMQASELPWINLKLCLKFWQASSQERPCPIKIPDSNIA